MPSVSFPQHASIDGFDIVDGVLAIGGVPLPRLAERVGSTPFYAYSRAAIRSQVARLRAVLPPALHLHYAIKANPMPAVVQLLASLTDGLDVASAREMQIALDTGVAPERISFAGPGKGEHEIRQAVAAGITLNLESATQARLAIELGERLGIAPQLAIRVNPVFELKASGMKMSGGAKPFGVDEAHVPELIRLIEGAGARVRGFHIFTGAQNLSASALIDAQRMAFETGLRLADGLRTDLAWLNIGGGFGVPYFPGEKPLDLGPVAEGLASLCGQATSRLRAPLVLELGRYFVSAAGVYVCRVRDRKVSQGHPFVVVDGGLHHHLAASGNFGQVLRKNYPVAIGNRMGEEPREVQTVVGPLCTPLDILADRMALPPAQVGDLVVVFQSGAYGPTASPQAFLSHPSPIEVLV